MNNIILYIYIALALVVGCDQNPEQKQVLHTLIHAPGAVYKEGPVKGRMIDANFPYGDSAYHGIIQASNGNVYYVICSHHIDSSACMFKYNPRSGKVTKIANLTEVLGENGSTVFSQGKVHSKIHEHEGKLYFGTHCGAYKRGGSKERGPYPGGHFMSYDLTTGEFEDYGIGEPEEGMVCMDMDKERGRMYTVTYPSLIFVYHDIASGTKKSFGKSVVTPGIDDVMKVTGPRSLAIDPRTGNVYWNNFDESIACYDYARDTVETIEEPNFNRPILKVSIPGQYRTNWRSIRWNDKMQRFYGVMYQSEYLFSFEPLTKDIEIIDRIAAEPKRKSGQGHYGSLAFELSTDGKTIYYLVSTPGQIAYPDTTVNGRIVHLVTYNISLRQYIDHGPLELEDGRKPSYCQSLAVGNDDNLYAICAIPFTDLESEKGKKLVEYRPPWTPKKNYKYSITERNLVVIKNPFAEK